MQVGMIGMGNFGSALAQMIAQNGTPVLGWEHATDVVDEINRDQRNSRYLAGVALHPAVRASADLQALAACDVLFVALPSAFIRPTLTPLAATLRADALLVNMAKGIDRHTGLTAYQTLGHVLPGHRRLVLSGPSVANEFVRGMPTVVVLAGANRSDQLTVARLLDGPTFRTRFSADAIGVELGGILKNIYAIGLGLLDGRGVTSVNFRSVYLTIALEEMARFGVALGAQVDTFLYLSGIGDLLATALSEHSHNGRLGRLLADGLPLDAIRRQMGVLPEGYNTLEAVLYLSEKLHVALPLAHGLWDVIHARQTAEHFMSALIRDFVD